MTPEERAAIKAHVLGLFPEPDGPGGLKLYSREDMSIAIEETLDAVEALP